MQSFTIPFNAQNISELLDPNRGVTTTSIREMTPTLLGDLCRQAATLMYEPAKHVVTQVEQNFFGCSEFAEASIWRHMANQLADGLEHAFRRHGKLDLLTPPLRFTDMALQEYPETVGDKKFGIGPHRDQSAFINLVVVLLLRGPSAFFICKDKSMADSVEIPAKPGELIIMRGGGFAGGSLSRPCHYVGPIDTRGRLSFGMRQVPNDPAAAEQIRKLFSGTT